MNLLSLSFPVWRFAVRQLSPAGRGARLTILIYHRVIPIPDPLQPEVLEAVAFDAQMTLVKSLFHVLPLTHAVAALRAGDLPERAACITFDDGYADNLTHALPILQRHGLPATFFIATDYLDGGRMFNDTVIEAVRRAPAGEHDLTQLSLGRYALKSLADRIGAIAEILPRVKYLPLAERAARVSEIAEQFGPLASAPLPDDLMLTSEQLRQLHGTGMEIGAHTASHPILARLTETEARDEIARGKARLEELLNTEIRLFAYPNGRPGQDYLPAHVALLQEFGFAGAVSTASGVAIGSTDLYQLPRFSPWSRNATRAALLLLQNLAQRQPDPALL